MTPVHAGVPLPRGEHGHDGTGHDGAVPEPDRAPPAAGAPRPASAPGPASRRWRAAVADWARPAGVAAAGTVVLRLVSEWVGLVSQYGVTFPHQVARTPGLLTRVWGHWDAGYYVSIAQYGYPGRHVSAGQAANDIAFAPLFPALTKVVHGVTGFGYLTSSEIVSLAATWVALTVVYRLTELEYGRDVAGAAVTMVLAWPAAFFLVAPYPEALALALAAGAFVAVRRGRWATAGVLAAGATMTKYYLALLVVALGVAVWEARPEAVALRATWRRDLGRLARAVVPTVAVFGAWTVYQVVHVGDALAFERAQGRQWHRHLAAPWTLLASTVSDLVHWRFLDTSRASVVELFDFVTVVLLAVVAVVLWRGGRRSWAVVLGLAWCVYCFESFLVGEVREVLVLFPLFGALGAWVARHRWRERVALALFLPGAYFLVERFVRGAFAG